ncbi:phenylacetate--CoA ligase family protein [Haloarcula onubensis]|uniref:Phenylacetate--CoA ligase family protein n=1 Tax=Haloarcula onubensis TaxID=2950539 RepID=A0ABU2FPV2_9EURY|nr:phenylacetate--CoA ligase family protein [Halomicroarcula sp. S3CR25-11]MDS0282774.1 phenylacetate--CoA ligase family protein [Halomicroarcula sp. S3CR25-11]
MGHVSAAERLRIRVDAVRLRRAARGTVRTRQSARLQSLLSTVRSESRFYRRLYADLERPLTLDSLPPVTKPELMAAFDDVVTDPAVDRAGVDAFLADRDAVGERFLGRYPVWTTSGTTGEPGVFLQDDRALVAADAVGDRWMLPAIADVDVLARLVRARGRLAEIAVGGGHFAAASGVELLRREHPLLRDRVRLVDADQPLPDIVAELDAFRPAILIGYATVLLALERAQRAGRLSLDPAYIAPTGEAILPAQKVRLRETFGCPVRETYGATEFYGLATECGHGNLHANTDWAILEPVDEDYRPVPPGEPSETVLLTNLANRIQPLVRYDLGDSVTMHADRCPCGSHFPVLEVEGRQGDVLTFESRAGERVPVFPLALSTVVEETPGVVRCQLRQTGPRTVRVRLDAADGADQTAVWPRVEAALADFFAARDLPVAAELSAETPRRDPESGKYRYVWSDAP